MFQMSLEKPELKGGVLVLKSETNHADEIIVRGERVKANMYSDDMQVHVMRESGDTLAFMWYDKHASEARRTLLKAQKRGFDVIVHDD